MTKLKRSISLLFLILALGAFTFGCSSNNDDFSQNVKEGAEEVKDETEDAVEEVEDEVDDMTDEY